MTTAREKIKNVANDKISPYRGSYVPTESELVVSDSKYNSKYLLLFVYIILGLILIMGSMK